MTDSKIIEGLHDLFSTEYYLFCYIFQLGHMIKGLALYDPYHEFFHVTYEAEFEHVHMLANHLAGLNEVVQLPLIEKESVFITNEEELKEALLHMYEVYMGLIRKYTELAKVAEFAGDYAYANIFQSMAEEKEKNRQELAKRLGYNPS